MVERKRWMVTLTNHDEADIILWHRIAYDRTVCSYAVFAEAEDSQGQQYLDGFFIFNGSVSRTFLSLIFGPEIMASHLTIEDYLYVNYIKRNDYWEVGFPPETPPNEDQVQVGAA